MAAAPLTVQASPVLAGAVLTWEAAEADGNYWANTGNEIVLITNNDDNNSITATFDSPATCSMSITGSSHDKVITVAAGATKIAGPFPKNRFNDVDGRVQITWAGDAVESDVVVAVVRK